MKERKKESNQDKNIRKSERKKASNEKMKERKKAATTRMKASNARQKNRTGHKTTYSAKRK